MLLQLDYISLPRNEAYGVSYRLNDAFTARTSTTCELTVYEEVTTNRAVESIHVLPNQAYETTMYHM